VLTINDKEMNMIFTIIQVTSAILLMLAILLQSKGSALGSAFGDNNHIAHTKRGAEKFLHNASIVLAIVFLISSFLNVIY
jgi:protein translocase SecG subunit